MGSSSLVLMGRLVSPRVKSSVNRIMPYVDPSSLCGILAVGCGGCELDLAPCLALDRTNLSPAETLSSSSSSVKGGKVLVFLSVSR
jgi:hypothetical protein